MCLSLMTTPCERCGHEIAIGEWPLCPHGFATVRAYKPFVPYFDEGLGAAASEATKLAVSRAESRQQGLALLFMAPEMQRR